MFHFSQIHPWQGEQAVQQILVFPTLLLKEEFERDFAERVAKEGDKASDSKLGAIYKVRAVKNSKDKWAPMIRCGSSGEDLVRAFDIQFIEFDEPEQALHHAMAHLSMAISNDLKVVMNSLEDLQNEQA